MILEKIDVMMFKQHLEDKGLSSKTVGCYFQVVNDFTNKDPKMDDVQSYNDYLIEKSLKQGKRNYMAQYAFKAFIEYKFGKGSGLLKNLIKVRAKSRKTPRVYLTLKKRVEVISGLEEIKHQVIALIQMWTGARVGDILRCVEGCISIDESEGAALKIDVVGKGDKPYTVFIHDEYSIKLITRYIDSHFGKNSIMPYLFLESSTYRGSTTKESTLLLTNYNRYLDDLKHSLANANIPIESFATHDFRRNIATDVYQKHKDVMILKSFLHHKNVETSLKYISDSGIDIKQVSADLYK